MKGKEKERGEGMERKEGGKEEKKREKEEGKGGRRGECFCPKTLFLVLFVSRHT